MVSVLAEDVSQVHAPLDKPRILIVDDEPDITNALKLGLERSGFSVDVSNDPKFTVAKFRPQTYDVAILDIRMPGLSGFELYRELKKRDDQVSFCFLTAFEVYRSEFSKVFPDISVKTFLKKPVTLAQLVPRLNEVMKQRPALMRAEKHTDSQK